MTTATVVICVYTEKRWGDIVAAVESVAGAGRRAARDAGGRRPQPGPAGQRARGRALRRAGAGQRARPGPVRRPQHRHRGGEGRRRGRSSTTTPAPDPAGSPPCSSPTRTPRSRPSAGWRTRGGRRGPTVAGAPTCSPARHPTTATPPASSTGSSAAPTPASRPRRPRCATSWAATCRSAARCSSASAASPRTSAASASNPLGCEETELCIRARQTFARAGEKIRIVFEPRAEVDHRVSHDRVEWAYLRRRSWAEGLSKAAVSRAGRQRRRAVHRARLRRQGAARGRRPRAEAAAHHLARRPSSPRLACTSAGLRRAAGCPARRPRVRLPAAGRWLSRLPPAGHELRPPPRAA